MRRGGERILDALLAHLAPVGWQQINLTGDYPWDADAGLGPDGFRPLRSAAIDESPSRSETTGTGRSAGLARIRAGEGTAGSSPDSPLEGGVSCELVSEKAKIPC